MGEKFRFALPGNYSRLRAYSIQDLPLTNIYRFSFLVGGEYISDDGFIANLEVGYAIPTKGEYGPTSVPNYAAWDNIALNICMGYKFF